MNRDLIPVASAGIAAVIWGIWWVPIRALEALGLQGAWAGLVMNSGALLLALIVLAVLRKGLVLDRRALMGAALVGVAVSTYSTALTYTDVVRAVLLFYVAPVWSKLIEWAFLKLPWHWTSSVALGAALLGAYLVLGGDVSLGSLNFGDVMVRVSGVAWAAGASLVFAGGKPSALVLTTVTMAATVLVTLPFAFGIGAPVIAEGEAGRVIGLAALFGAIYVLPIMAMTLWAAQRLAPATITFLLSAEILSGVISGALLLDEPFGWMQGVGAALIILAATSEIFAGLRVSAANRD